MNYHLGSEHFRAADDDRQLARPGEETAPTQVMIAALMKHVRQQFYTSWPEKKWLQEQRLILMVLTWPATWLNQRGIGLPLDRYERILRDIILEVQRHGATGEIKFFPAYFERTVKSWFIHNGEALYEERKSIRDALDLRFLRGMKTTAPTGPDPMQVLAQTNAVLATTRRRAKSANHDESQHLLF